MENKVVITGVGIYSCLGTSVDEVKKSLFEGRSGIGIDPRRIALGFQSALTGLVPKPELKKLLKRRQRIGLGEQGEYAYVSTVEALKMANIDQAYLDQNEVGILFGNDSCARAVIDSVDVLREKKDTSLIGSAPLFQTMNCTVTMNLSTIFKLKGVNFTISGACASGSHSVGMAYTLIKAGLQEMIICGGAQEINAESMGAFDALGAFATNEDPTKASKPFDKYRSGLVPSGGAATLVLESYESAVKRGATILAEVAGYGFSSNGDHISVPNVDGPVRALNKALKQAKMRAEEIDYVNAHATSTPVGDGNEAKAIDEVFGAKKPFVSSTKSMTGHECWMAGASEVIYSLIMMNNDFVAPNINFDEPDEDSQKLNIVSKTKETKINALLTNSFGFGGTNAAIILKKYGKDGTN
ncbi:beta-ketoacyl-[acyl-carrier-protein] synthase family protein [Persicobacter psychrovividus]|uniref:3-oxoacyl-[acyl-carrier-protein] synthase 1 n=1 Tax=Persicobacter psychrovividus TaxID=387638 RepID=A0ABN6LG41_9BACT|nr:beta-ketoacyl synthase [Persicobacter psychrovividus]